MSSPDGGNGLSIDLRDVEEVARSRGVDVAVVIEERMAPLGEAIDKVRRASDAHGRARSALHPPPH